MNIDVRFFRTQKKPDKPRTLYIILILHIGHIVLIWNIVEFENLIKDQMMYQWTNLPLNRTSLYVNPLSVCDVLRISVPIIGNLSTY